MAKDGLPFEIERPEDTDFTNAIIYGETGAGKTHLLGTAVRCEEATPTLIIDVDGGSKTLRGIKVDMVRPSTWKEIQDIYDFFRHDNRKYRSLSIDSLTELQKKYSLGTILGDLKEDEYADLGSISVPSRQDWLKTGTQMRNVIRAFRALSYLRSGGDPIHVFMTCLEKFEEKKDLIGPAFSGSLAGESGAYVDTLARLSRIPIEVDDGDEGTRTINRRHLLIDAYTNEDGVRYLAKNRGSSRIQIWKPTIKKLIDLGREKEREE